MELWNYLVKRHANYWHAMQSFIYIAGLMLILPFSAVPSRSRFTSINYMAFGEGAGCCRNFWNNNNSNIFIGSWDYSNRYANKVLLILSDWVCSLYPPSPSLPSRQTSCITRSSAVMMLTVRNVDIIVFLGSNFQQPVSFKCWGIMSNEIYLDVFSHKG